MLQYQEVRDWASEALDWLDFPRQLFALKLTFTSSEHFVPVSSIRIPFTVEEARCGEPRGSTGMNKVLLKFQPIIPVPTCFGVTIAFNDGFGHMYFGQLERFCLSFQELFLPVRLPLMLWPHLPAQFPSAKRREAADSLRRDKRSGMEILMADYITFCIKFGCRPEAEELRNKRQPS